MVGPCVTLATGVTIDFKSMSDFNVAGYADAYVALRQFHPLSLGQTQFVKFAGDYLWYGDFNTSISNTFSWQISTPTAGGHFAIRAGSSIDGSGTPLYVGYDSAKDQLCVVPQTDDRYKTWVIERTVVEVPQTVVKGMRFNVYAGYFAGNVRYFDNKVGLQPEKVTTSLASLSYGTNGYLA
jgi:hypothetical protein